MDLIQANVFVIKTMPVRVSITSQKALETNAFRHFWFCDCSTWISCISFFVVFYFLVIAIM